MLDDQGIVAWMTGLSGSGKSTVAHGVLPILESKGLRVCILDGDDVRAQFHKHLGFSPEDIKENNRLIRKLAGEARHKWDLVLVPVITPFREDRVAAREALSPGYHEIYVRAELEEVRRRDPKGLYERAETGQLTGLIGWDAEVPYESPVDPDLILDTEVESPSDSIKKLARYLLMVIQP